MFSFEVRSKRAFDDGLSLSIQFEYGFLNNKDSE